MFYFAQILVKILKLLISRAYLSAVGLPPPRVCEDTQRTRSFRLRHASYATDAYSDSEAYIDGCVIMSRKSISIFVLTIH